MGYQGKRWLFGVFTINPFKSVLIDPVPKHRSAIMKKVKKMHKRNIPVFLSFLLQLSL